ncbi:hypothetical protein HD593_004021 [Nonomuraea rubra]|uniref:Uncharacterized protein n=1 Tax=Nonomuraea rubra TaxID=46180 RepID=A0A7X0TZ46_9ACTN|nr:hypothetical protein [Nonomuraea rubra]
MIDLDHPGGRPARRAPERERVEPRAEHHVLLETVAEQALGVGGAGGHLGAGAGEHHVVAVRAVVADELSGLAAQQGRGQGVAEEVRLAVHDEVDG